MFAGQQEIAREVLEQVPQRRIATQIEVDGRQPHELARTRSFDYSVMNLRGMFHLAALGDQLGLDLWNAQSEDGRGVRRALDWLIPFATGHQQWRHEQIRDLEPGKLAPLLRRAAIAYAEPEYAEVARQLGSDPADRTHLFWPLP